MIRFHTVRQAKSFALTAGLLLLHRFTCCIFCCAFCEIPKKRGADLLSAGSASKMVLERGFWNFGFWTKPAECPAGEALGAAGSCSALPPTHLASDGWGLPPGRRMWGTGLCSCSDPVEALDLCWKRRLWLLLSLAFDSSYAVSVKWARGRGGGAEDGGALGDSPAPVQLGCVQPAPRKRSLLLASAFLFLGRSLWKTEN